MKNLFFLSFWLVSSSFSKVQASSCCLSNALSGVGRLSPWEKGAIGFRTSFQASLGQWDSQKEWTFFKNHKEYASLSTFWGLWKVHAQTFLFVELPFQINFRNQENLSEWFPWFGDSRLGVRYEFISVGGKPKWPGIALISSITLPSGSSTLHLVRPSQLGTSITGQGVWRLNLALSVEKIFGNAFFRLDLGAGVPLPFWNESYQSFQMLGTSVSLSFLTGLQLVDGIVLSLVSSFSWDDAVRLQGKPLLNSQKILWNVGLAFSWKINSKWTLQASTLTALFASAFGQNQIGTLSASVGFRYAFSD